MHSPTKITVVLAEDHAIVRQGLRSLLNADGGFKIVGEAQTGREAVELMQTKHPDVIVMDIAMPVLNGIEATRQILALDPTAKVLILSAHNDEEYIERMTASGAVGFLEKQTSAEVLTKAIRAVAVGNSFFGGEVEKRRPAALTENRDRNGMAKAGASELTSRETEVLQLVAEGSANKQVAAVLGISVKTVEKHRQHLMDKLNIHQTAGLTRYAIASGVIENRVHLTIT
ncbi:MAG: response regulator transcription factor [Lacunisphaera sp.]